VRCDDADARRPVNPREASVRFRKDKVFEACTMQPFATVLEVMPGASAKQGMLTGTAVRCMLGMCWMEMTRAYAFGLYVDSSALRTLARRKYEWTSEDGAKAEPSRFLIDGKTTQPRLLGEITMALRMARDIDGPHMADGFKRSGEPPFRPEGAARAAPSPPGPAPRRPRHPLLPAVMKQLTLAQAAAAAGSLEPRLAKAMALDASLDLPEVERLAKAFLRLDTMAKGALVTFTWRQDGSLTMALDGEPVKELVLRRPAVIRALFDVYCGPSAVSVEASETFRTALARMVEALMAGESVTDAAARA